MNDFSTFFSMSIPHLLVLHQMWWVYNLKNYFKLQLLEFLLLGGQSIIGLLYRFSLNKPKIIIIRALKLSKFGMKNNFLA